MTSLKLLCGVLVGVMMWEGGSLAAPPDHRNQDRREQAREDARGKARQRARKEIRLQAARHNDRKDEMVLRMIARAAARRSCDQLNEVMRDLSNEILTAAEPGVGRGKRRQLRNAVGRDTEFWQKVWARIVEVYQYCDVSCFNDGELVGAMSGAGYCAASVGVGGLVGPGALSQAPLPLCEGSIFVGCQKGYREAVAGFDGCEAYAEGSYERVLNQFISQDCHVPN